MLLCGQRAGTGRFFQFLRKDPMQSGKLSERQPTSRNGTETFVRRGRQLHAAGYERVDDLIVKAIDIRDSYAYPANRQGLGIELDEEAVRRYRAA